MWMDSWLQDTLIRERIVDMQQRAARRQLLRAARSPRPANRLQAFVSRLVGATVTFRPKRRIGRVTCP